MTLLVLVKKWWTIRERFFALLRVVWYVHCRLGQRNVSTSPLFDLYSNVACLTVNADKCAGICCWGLPTATTATMHTNDVLEDVFVPLSSPFLSFMLSHSPLCAFGLAQAVASLLTLSSHFSKASPRQRLKITLIGCMAGTKGKGGLVIHLFYSLLRVVLKDLPTLSALERS